MSACYAQHRPYRPGFLQFDFCAFEFSRLLIETKNTMRPCIAMFNIDQLGRGCAAEDAAACFLMNQTE